MQDANQKRFDSVEFVRSLSHRPGVYRMLDAHGNVLYVGKARDLRKRVGSYFSRRATDAKTQALLQAVAEVETTVTATDQEALLLEYNLIKQHKPRFNVVLRDDKSYPYIRVTTEQEFPRIEFHRGSRRLPGRFFGPFPNAGAVRQTLLQMQRLFRVRPCPDSFFAHRSRPCLQYQIERCSAPCVGLVTAEEYRRDVDNAMRFVQGRNDAVLTDLIDRMERSSAGYDYERAARYRDQIAAIRRVQAQQVISAGSAAEADALAVCEESGVFCVGMVMIRGGSLLGSRRFFPRAAPGTSSAEVLGAFVTQHYLTHEAPAEILVNGEVPDAEMISAVLTARAEHPVAIRRRVRGTRRRWLDMAFANAQQAAAMHATAAATWAELLAALGEALHLSAPPERIECFDISHTAGGETVGACIVFGPAGPVKRDYRRFNVRDVTPGDDYGALAQVVARRYSRLRTEGAPPPDLILIDGGRGQLDRVTSILQELGLGDIAVAAVAKGPGRRPGREKLYREGARAPLTLAADSPAMRIIQQVRDEAHRFAITGHRQRRTRSSRHSRLETIPGLGPRRRRALLQHLGGLQEISRAGIDDLARVPGISRTLAARIYSHLHEDAVP
jgi:excinuclease ABC subunit C